MFYLVIIFVSVFLFKFFYDKKLVVDLKSFFCKGFKKYDNAFGLFAYTR